MYLLAQVWGEKGGVVSGIFRGVVDLLLKSFVGDAVDRTCRDRRNFLAAERAVIGLSFFMVYIVDGSNLGNQVLESVALAFLGRSFAAITLSVQLLFFIL